MCRPRALARSRRQTDSGVAHGEILSRARAARLSASGRDGGPRAAHGVLSRRPQQGHVRHRRSSSRCAACWRARRSSSASRRIPTATSRPAPSYRVSDLELAHAALVLPLEQHPRRRAARRSRRRGACASRRCSKRQVRRMLADPTADALVENFAGQWLHVRNLQNIAPNSDEFPDFDNDLRDAFRRETELFFGSIVARGSQRPRPDDGRLHVRQRAAGASTTALPDVYGSQFRRVTLDRAEARRGLLGKGSILMATSHADRTAPTLRGKWILENLLGIAAAGPAGQRAAARADGRARAEDDARADGVPPRQPVVRELPPHDGSARLRDRELRRGRRVADARRRRRPSMPSGAADRRQRAVDGVAELRDGAADAAGRLRRHAHREADDLRVSAAACSTTTCPWCAASSATRRQSDYRFSTIVLGHRGERAVPDAPEGATCRPRADRAKR